MFRLIGQIKHLLPVPKSDDRIPVAMHNEHRAMNMPNVPVIGKFVEEQQRNAGQYAKRDTKGLCRINLAEGLFAAMYVAGPVPTDRPK